MIDKVFGLWTVLEAKGSDKYLVRCDCGTEKTVRGSDLRNGKTRMCKQCSVSTNITHGMRNTPEYNTWVHMIQRCYNPKNKDYANYGGRGITVHDSWRKSFESFYMAIGPRPNINDTIERIDTNGNYEPGNVCWASRAEQNLNQRSNVVLTIAGESKTVSQWAEHPFCTVSSFTIYKRLNRGWEPERAVFAKSMREEADE